MRRKENGSLYVLLAIVAIIAGGVLYVYNSVTFEREVPAISMPNSGYWNLKDPLEVAISDVSGLKSYKISLKSDTDAAVLNEEQFLEP
ncbi:MAG: hypothetical protein QG617_1392, partial [Campylobacterota bacterium]|nr:hypothetical protein [Campylobacterota bacterium]